MISTRPHLLHGSAPEGLVEAVCARIESHGFAFSFGDCGRANGVTNWTTSTVTIRHDIEPSQSAKTALHDLLTHVIAHRPSGDFPYVCRGVKEVEAPARSELAFRVP